MRFLVFSRFFQLGGHFWILPYSQNSLRVSSILPRRDGSIRSNRRPPTQKNIFGFMYIRVFLFFVYIRVLSNLPAIFDFPVFPTFATSFVNTASTRRIDPHQPDASNSKDTISELSIFVYFFQTCAVLRNQTCAVLRSQPTSLPLPQGLFFRRLSFWLSTV